VVGIGSVSKGLLEWALVSKVSKVNMVSEVRRLKASIPYLYTNSNRLCEIPGFAAFPAASVQLKKPSGGPKGLIGPPCHGAPGRRRQKSEL
jgi:hypothetical protein